MGTNFDSTQTYLQTDVWKYTNGLSDTYTMGVPAVHYVHCSPTIKTPQWRERRRKNPVWVPPTPYTRASYEQTFIAGESIQRYNDGTIRTITGPQYGAFMSEDPQNPVANNVGRYMDIAQNRALGKLSELKVNWGEAFATRAQTCDLVGDNILGIAKIALLIRRGQWDKLHRLIGKPGRRGRKTIRTFLDLWLQYQYGWYPLVSDIYSLADIQNARDNENQHSYHFNVRGYYVEEIKANTFGPKDTLLNAHMKKYTYVKARSKLWYELGTASDEFGRSLDQLGIRNPALLAWELLPYSFVIDWVFPIGSWLESFSAQNGLKFLSGTRSVSWVHSRDYEESARSPVGPNGVGLRQFRHHESNVQEYYNRDTVSSPSYKVFAKNPFTPTHMLNAIALLKNVLLR